jgi:endonuclease/exonuclease/phosphatase family metal-dependent hydrolase
MKPKYLRFMTLNLWGENGPWESRLALVGEKLTSLQPDVVALQEVRDVPGRIFNQAGQLGRRRGYYHVFAPSTDWGGGQEGLAILSRFPIGAHEVRALPHTAEKEGRIVLSARIESDLGEVWVHTTHLSYREHEGREREDQVLAIDEAITAHKSDSPQVLMGDFNAVPHSDEMRWLCGLTTLGGRRVFYQDSWDVMHASLPGFTWSRVNSYTGRMAFLRGDRRLDYIFVTPARRDGRGTVHSSRLLLDEPKVMPDGERLFASDHFAVVAEIQLVANETATEATP